MRAWCPCSQHGRDGHAVTASTVLHFPRAHDGTAGPLHLAADRDGPVILVSTNDGRDGVCRWDAARGTLLWRSTDDLSGVNDLAAVRLPGGRWVVAAAGDDGVDCWDAGTGDGLSGRERHSGTVWGLAAAHLADGGAMLVGAGDGGEVHRWDPLTGRPLGAPLLGHRGSVKSVAAQTLPNGRTVIASGGDDGHVHCWDATTGRSLGTPLEGSGSFTQVCLVPPADGRTLIAACDTGGSLHRWDAIDGIPVGSPVEMGAYAPMLSAVRLGGEPVLVTSGEDGTVRRWHAVTGELIDTSLAGVAAMAAVRGDGTVLLATGTRAGDLTVHAIGQAHG
ncbi:WD40 repeat domain-containing protein [Kitasatospora sp. NPDC059571]|uniref:WD40 repeat domain-containing protein n=1 Tax=Kitasatospora sp. NPDC059571 TaxID=3346871 RepID=UPI0036C35DD8